MASSGFGAGVPQVSLLEAVRGDVRDVTRGLEMVSRALLAAAERCAAMEQRLDERQRRLDESWRRMEERALALEATMTQRWCAKGASPEDRLVALEESVERAIKTVFPRVEMLLSLVEESRAQLPSLSKESSTSSPSSSSSAARASTSSSVSTHSPATASSSSETTKKPQPSTLSNSPCAVVASTSLGVSSRVTSPSSSSTIKQPQPSLSCSPSSAALVSTSSSVCAHSSVTASSSSSSTMPPQPSHNQRDSMLREAANDGRLIDVSQLLLTGANPNSTNNSGHSALHCAAMSCSPECIDLLVAHGAVVDIKDCEENTPLHIAARLGCVETTRALLKCGASPSAENGWELTPYDVTHSKEIQKLLRVYSTGDPLTVDSSHSIHDPLLLSDRSINSRSGGSSSNPHPSAALSGTRPVSANSSVIRGSLMRKKVPQIRCLTRAAIDRSLFTSRFFSIWLLGQMCFAEMRLGLDLFLLQLIMSTSIACGI